MISTFAKQKLAVASAMALALMTAQAQTADSGSLLINGQITASTCVLNMTGSTGGTSNGGQKIVTLGSVSSATAGTGTAGTTFGNAVTTTFTLGSASSSGPAAPCAFGTGNSSWDISLVLTPDQLTSVNSKNVLKNGAASNATNAVVILKGGVGSATTTLNLIGDAGLGGNLMSGALSAGVITAGAASSIQLSAQFARAETGAPSAGVWSQTIPLLVVYR